MFDRIWHNKVSGKPAGAERDLPTQASPDVQQSGSNSKKYKKKKNGKPTAASLAPGGNSKSSDWLDNSKVEAYCYSMSGHVSQTVDCYLELAEKSKETLKRVATPCIDDHQIPPEEFGVKGVVTPIAARVVLKALYVARIARMDFMWAVNSLAREVISGQLLAIVDCTG